MMRRGKHYYNIDSKMITFKEWQELYFPINGNSNRKIKLTIFTNEGFISTVFLGLKHPGPGSLNIFETMYFQDGDNESDELTIRYDTLAEASKGHDDEVKEVMDLHKDMIILSESHNKTVLDKLEDKQK